MTEPVRPTKQDRAARLAEQLRANLRKRKQQAREAKPDRKRDPDQG